MRGNMGSRRERLLAVVVVAGLFGPSGVAGARSLSDVLNDRRFANLELAALAPALADTVASTYPIPSASSSVVYAYNAALGTFERLSRVAGPLAGERAETVGRGRVTMGLSYAYVDLASINGDDLGDLENKPVVDGRVIAFPVAGGTTLRDGRFTNFLPVRVSLDLDIDAHILSPSLTYGITPDLDVNLVVPMIRTSLDVTAKTQVPDPRFPSFALPPGNPNARRTTLSDGEDAYGIGDLLLRAKYVLLRSRLVAVAGGLDVALPTGDEENLHGTGHVRIQPTLILSHVFADRVEPFVNAGIVLNTDDVDRSILRWVVGATVRIADPWAAGVVFLGRHELAAQADKIERPFFFQIERNDVVDAAVGLRYAVTEQASIAANVVVPLNDDGFRPDATPTLQLEYTF